MQPLQPRRDAANPHDTSALAPSKKEQMPRSRTASEVSIHIDKQIPVGAGLGGGSSDAAAMLRHLNGASAHPLSEEQLAAVALSLGADVPVCLAGTAQRMQGKHGLSIVSASVLGV